MNLRFPTQDSATGRGFKTGLQAVIGYIVTFAVGLVLTVWHVPGVPHAVLQYCQNNFVQVALLFGVPSGIAALVWNIFRKDVPNY